MPIGRYALSASRGRPSRIALTSTSQVGQIFAAGQSDSGQKIRTRPHMVSMQPGLEHLIQ